MKKLLIGFSLLLLSQSFAQKQIKLGTAYTNSWAAGQDYKNNPSQKFGFEGGFQIKMSEKFSFLLMSGFQYGVQGFYGRHELGFSLSPQTRFYFKELMKGFYLGLDVNLTYYSFQRDYFYLTIGPAIYEYQPQYYAKNYDVQIGFAFNAGYEIKVSDANTINPFVSFGSNPFQEGYNILGKFGINVSF